MYGPDVHCLAFKSIQRGNALRQTARDLGIGATTVHRWRKTSHWWAEICTRKKARERVRRTRKYPMSIDDSIRSLISATAHVSISGLQLQMARDSIPPPSISTIWRYVRRLGYTRRRLSSKPLGIRSNEALCRFLIDHGNLLGENDNRLIVSVDECHFSRRLYPLYGYSLKGQERVATRTRRPGGESQEGKSRSLIMAIGSDGSMYNEVESGSVKRNRFQEFVKNLPFPRGTILLLDNCSIHHGNDGVYASKGYVPLFLPPYSPDLQPVELCFSKVKHIYRQSFPWNTSSIDDVIANSVSKIKSSDILNWFEHCKRLQNALK